MAKRKKRVWNMSNPLYRYLHKKKTKTVRTRTVKRKVKRRAVRMARRHRKSGRKSFNGGMGGLAKSALIGIGSAHLAAFVPVNVPYKEEAAGAIGAYLIGGKNVKSAAIGAGAVFLTKMLAGQTSGTSGSSVSGF